MSKSLSFSQLAEHSTSEDCWLLIGGKVYDVTKFLEEHPGGDDVLLSATGKDATDDFEDVGHSKTARDLMKDFFVGEIDVLSVPKEKFYKPPTQPAYEQDKSKEFYMRILQFLIPLVILGCAIAMRYYTKSTT